MTGPDAIKVPSQAQSLGGKNVSNLIGPDVSIKWSGVNGLVSGTIKYIGDYSELYGESEKSGNFFPTLLTAKGRELKTTNGTKIKTQTFPDDGLLVSRIAQKSDKLTIDVDGKIIAILDFSGATFEQAGAEAAYRATARSRKSK